ncbi:NUDIX hydrolase [Ideonella livida]|uniref:DUF4743 domain-containing protein n=1 Tax=Ideonella livida TaxID=2707176 RepID=A0A7C9PG79_9BURK|nr:DUF4743 domain-containing protein [Ideonella livida]NDY91157.1 DUF4743 domain-containing protein [Ideonella livida]
MRPPPSPVDQGLAPAAPDDLRGWPALAAARHQQQARVPFWVGGPEEARPVLAGSVARADLPALADWPALLALTPEGVHLRCPAADRDPELARLHQALRQQGRIRAWRDEPYPLLAEDGRHLAVIERAAARFWGAITFGVHCNGYVAGPDGRPTGLWIARRADHKPTDPGRLDNLVGGGVPLGQTPRQALCREAWEEAGLRTEELVGLRAGSVLSLTCDLPEGLQREWLHVYDLALPAGREPCNQDGEVAWHRLMPVAQALALAAAGELTVDASLATLDFALRHGLLAADAAAPLAAALAALRVPPEAAARVDPPVGK